MATSNLSTQSTWRRAAVDIGIALAEGTSLTFVLGAGASLTSKGPSSSDVDTALAEATSRFGSRAPTRYIHAVADSNKNAALSPLFRDAHPYLGYRMLAAMARTRKVVVINLNWDGLLATACRELGVPCASYDLTDSAQWHLGTGASKGVIDIHVHGELGRTPRYGVRETVGFSDAEVRHVGTLHGGSDLALLGVSLDDPDIGDLLERVHGRGGVHGFFRGERSDQDLWRELRELLPGRHPFLVVDSGLDFDTALLLIADRAAGGVWDQLRRLVPQLEVPSLSNIVLPKASFLQRAVAARPSVLVGDAQLGKTTAALLISVVRQLESGRGIRHFDGPDPAIAALEVGGGAGSILVVENPFGEEDDFMANPAFPGSLDRFLSSNEDPIVVTSRAEHWAKRSADLPTVDILPSNPDEWYDLNALAQYASDIGDPDLVDAVHSRILRTPAEVRDAARGVPVARSGAGGSRRGVLGRLELLAQDRASAGLCALVRLTEFAGIPIDRQALERVAGVAADATVVGRVVLHDYEWEGLQLLRLASAVDRAAVDSWLGDNHDVVASLLSSSLAPRPLADAFEAWLLMVAVAMDDWSSLENQSGRVSDISAQLLEVSPTVNGLRAVAAARHDAWSTADVAYVLTRLWEELPTPGREELLSALIADFDNVGLYSVLEACLYLRRASPPAVRAAVAAGLHDALARADDWQVALALDGLVWRPMSDDSLDGFRRAVASRIRQEPDSNLAGALRLAAAYHPDGVAALDLADLAKSIRRRPWSQGQAGMAADLAAWHFAHQSRARATIARQHWVDKQFLCRSLHPPVGNDSDADAVDDFISGLTEAGHGGWAFHGACFLLGALERPLPESTRELAAEALRSVSAADVGVISAAATYEVAATPPFRRHLRAYLRETQSRHAFLDALSAGLLVAGTVIRPPRFLFALPAETLHEELDLRFDRLRVAGVRLSPWPNFMDRVVDAAEAAVEKGETKKSAERVLALVAAGDLRPLEDAVAAFGATASRPLVEIVSLACRAVEATA